VAPKGGSRWFNWTRYLVNYSDIYLKIVCLQINYNSEGEGVLVLCDLKHYLAESWAPLYLDILIIRCFHLGICQWKFSDFSIITASTVFILANHVFIQQIKVRYILFPKCIMYIYIVVSIPKLRSWHAIILNILNQIIYIIKYKEICWKKSTTINYHYLLHYHRCLFLVLIIIYNDLFFHKLIIIYNCGCHVCIPVDLNIVFIFC